MRTWDSDVPGGDAGPTVHGVYDFWLDGCDHLRSDRELARAIGVKFPGIPVHVRMAREFHLRAARWCAREGITRLIGSGIAGWKPRIPNLHDAAREVAPEASAVYVLRDAGGHARARAVLPGPGLQPALARAEVPAGVLSAAPVAAMIAEGEPVGLALGLSLQYSPPGAAAAQVAAYAAALPPGSAVIVSVPLVDHSPEADELLAMFTPARAWRYTARDVEGWLEGARLKVEGPGACDVRALPGGGWAKEKLPSRPPGMTVGALARKL